MEKDIKYIIITPVRDEEKYIQKTIDSVASQSIRPVEWIIVNDGSKDSTPDIINKSAKEYLWIKPIHREDRGFRKAGGGVIEAFYDGYKEISASDWQYIVKLDGDLSFEPDYFKKCFLEFDRTPKLGIGGGMIWSLINGKLFFEKDLYFHVRGATKIYKRECWDAIGGLLKAPGWDTIDEVKANMLEWTTRSFSDIKLIQLKFTGSADGTWANRVKNGRANYISGYHPLFMFLKCIKRLLQKPYAIGSIALFYGFLTGYFKRIPQVPDQELIKYLRSQQIKRIFGQKSIWY